MVVCEASAGEMGCGQWRSFAEDVVQPMCSFGAPVAEHGDLASGQVADVALGREEAGPAQVHTVEMRGDGAPVGQQVALNTASPRATTTQGLETDTIGFPPRVDTRKLPSAVLATRNLWETLDEGNPILRPIDAVHPRRGVNFD